MKKIDLKDKVAIVTAAGRGMGIGIAKVFGEAGATVAVTYNANKENAEKLCEEIRAMGTKAEAFQLDQRKPEDCNHVIKEVVDTFGKVNILINNAGVNCRVDSLEFPEETWDCIVDTNMKGSFYLSCAAAQQMIAQGTGGTITSIASINGMIPLKGAVPYDASKAGIIMATKNLALDFGKYGIRVNAVAPGLMDAPGLDEAVPGWRESYEERSALGRIGQWEDIGNVCLFLSSEMASWITGQTIVADGGVTIAPAY